jgi:Spy/CpxP family protein refolding chaperone
MSARTRRFALLLAPTLLLGPAVLSVTPAFAQSGASSHGAHGGTGMGGTGMSGGTAAEESVRQELQRQGFSDIRDIRREGDKFVAMATKDGKATKVEVLASSLGSDSTR